MSPGQPYVLQFFKHPDSPHWRHEAVWLGEDEFGVWLGAKAGARHQKGPEPARMILRDQVHLVPRSAWWVLTYNPRHPTAVHWIDVSTPASFEPDRVLTVDLDLDVARSPDGRVWIEDQDEFELHQHQLQYTREMVATAAATAESMAQALEELVEPFRTVAGDWLSRLQ